MFKLIISYLTVAENGVHTGQTVLEFDTREEADTAYNAWIKGNSYSLEVIANHALARMNTRITKLY